MNSRSFPITHYARLFESPELKWSFDELCWNKAPGWFEEKYEFISSCCKSFYSSCCPGAIHPILQIALVQNTVATVVWQGIESILSPKQQRQPLPSHLSFSFFYAPITLGVDRQDGVQYSLVGGLHSAAQPIHGRLWPGRHRLVSSAEGGPGGEGGIQVNSYSNLSKIYSIKSGSENREAFRWNSIYNISAVFKNYTIQYI